MRDWLDLTGRVALVTGADRGIGRDVVSTLASRGASVIAVHHEPEWVPLELDPEGVRPIRVDLSEPRQIERCFDVVRSEFGTLDILVNNAGVYPRRHCMELDEATWDHVIDVNLKASFLCTQQGAVLMRQRKRGRVVNVASSAAWTGPPRGAHYAASKAGLVAITKSFARALGREGIAVNAVAPGITRTGQPGLDEAGFLAEGERIPWGRVGTVEDMSRAVLYLVSDLSEYVTGQTLFVNGGALLLP